jgi:hypothetical protein
MFLFARRQQGYELAPGGAAVIAKPEDGIYLTITGEDEITPPAGGVMSAEQMASWLQELHASRCSMRAVDGYGNPLNINPAGDR